MVPLLDFIRSAVKDMPSYKTVKKRAHDEFTEKRSRFIGYVCPVQTVEEANGFISEIKQKHWDAKHNVYAYILRDGNIKKYSDDGEPQGTAGVPVLDVLEKATSKMSALSQQGTSAEYFWEAEDSSERIRIPQK